MFLSFTVLPSDNDVLAMSMTVHVFPINQPRLDFQQILILRKLPFHTNQNTKIRYKLKKKIHITTVFVLYLNYKSMFNINKFVAKIAHQEFCNFGSKLVLQKTIHHFLDLHAIHVLVDWKTINNASPSSKNRNGSFSFFHNAENLYFFSKSGGSTQKDLQWTNVFTKYIKAHCPWKIIPRGNLIAATTSLNYLQELRLPEQKFLVQKKW